MWIVIVIVMIILISVWYWNISKKRRRTRNSHRYEEYPTREYHISIDSSQNKERTFQEPCHQCHGTGTVIVGLGRKHEISCPSCNGTGVQYRKH